MSLRFHDLGIVGVLAVACHVYGQSFTGAVAGTVRDATGAVVPGTTISLTNLATNEKRTQGSKEDGGYLFALVAPGQYQLEAERSGFKKFVRSSIAVEVQQSVVIDIP